MTRRPRKPCPHQNPWLPGTTPKKNYYSFPTSPSPFDFADKQKKEERLGFQGLCFDKVILLGIFDGFVGLFFSGLQGFRRLSGIQRLCFGGVEVGVRVGYEGLDFVFEIVLCVSALGFCGESLGFLLS